MVVDTIDCSLSLSARKRKKGRLVTTFEGRFELHTSLDPTKVASDSEKEYRTLEVFNVRRNITHT